MKPEVLAYFRPPQQLIEESLKKIKAVMEFQSYHRNRFSKFQRDRLDKYQQRLLLEQERSATRVWEKIRILFIMIETILFKIKESSNFYGNRSSSRVPGMNSSMVSISDNNQQQHENSNAPLWPTSSSFNSSIGSHSSARQNHQNTTSNSASYSYHQNNTSNSSLPYRLPPNSSGSVRMEKPQILASYSASRYSSTTSAFSRPTSSMSVRQSQSSSFGSGIGQVSI
jgi:hypothetical protein